MKKDKKKYPLYCFDVKTKEINKISSIADKLFKEVSKEKAKILDDFCKAYLASRFDDYFKKKGKIEIGRLELVEQIKSSTEKVYFYRLKKGRIKK